MIIPLHRFVKALSATLLTVACINAFPQPTQKLNRQQGLMYREKMAQNEGMAFVFDRPAAVCMWMKNTFLPLSVAFIAEDGKIINIEDMKPQTLDTHCAKKPARYALEMNKGWFKQKNINPGSIIEGLPPAR
ncbi:MAG: DUF192 domain-containing protein [Pseudomonadota bacterium]